MTEDFVDSIVDKRRIKDQLGGRDDTQIVMNRWKNEQLNIYNIRIKISKKAMGNGFVIGHSTNSILGTTVPQIYIGAGTIGNETEWTLLSETPGPELITDSGKNLLARFIKGDSVDHFNYIAYGTGTTAFNINQTDMVSETKRIKTFGAGPK